MSGEPNLSRSMQLALVMLGNALPNVEAGAVTEADRRTWAAGLEHLARELRAFDAPIVLEGGILDR